MALAAKMKRKWARNVKDKGRVLLEEVKEVVVNPMELAAEQDSVRIAKLKEFNETGLWPKIMKAIPKDLWVEMVEKAGVANYDTSVKAKKKKQETFADKFAGILEEAKRKAKAAPGVTLAERLERVRIVVEDVLIPNKSKWRFS